MSNDLVIALKVTEGMKDRRTFRVHKNRIVLGSVVSSDVRLPAEGVAPIHAVIEVMDGVATIYDLASESGVYVNTLRTVTQRLKPGDHIRIGVVHLTFSLEEASQAVAAPLVATPISAPVSAPVMPTSTQAEGRMLFVDPKEDRRALLLETGSGTEESIFEYRPSEVKALEVVMSWRGTILDVEHFVGEREVTVGNARRSDFAIPPVLSSTRFPIVSRQGEQYTLNVDTKMRGVISRKGVLQSLDERASDAQPAPLPFISGDFAKLSVGDLDFFLSFTQAPPRLKRRRIFEADALLFRVLGASLALTAALIAAMWNARVPQAIEAEQLPDRLATILYQPEKYSAIQRVEPPAKNPANETEPKAQDKKTKPKEKAITKLDLNSKAKVGQSEDQAKASAHGQNKGSKQNASKVAQSQAKEGEGARARGKEGKRGSKSSKTKGVAQNAAKRPSPLGGVGSGGSQSQLDDEGNVDFLKGASSKIQNLLSSSAQRLGKGGEKLQGFGAFNSQGNGGLALGGSGEGGGGNAETKLGGLGDKGQGGGRVGTGKGAAGSGSGIIGGKARVVIRSGGPEEAVVMGSIDAAAVEAALLAHKAEFRYCYEQEINFLSHPREKSDPLPKISGRVGTNFTIGPSGRVTHAVVENSTLGNARIEDCIVRVIKSIDFPAPRGGGIVQVTYPFKFSATN